MKAAGWNRTTLVTQLTPQRSQKIAPSLSLTFSTSADRSTVSSWTLVSTLATQQDARYSTLVSNFQPLDDESRIQSPDHKSGLFVLWLALGGSGRDRRDGHFFAVKHDLVTR